MITIIVDFYINEHTPDNKTTETITFMTYSYKIVHGIAQCGTSTKFSTALFIVSYLAMKPRSLFKLCPFSLKIILIFVIRVPPFIYCAYFFTRKPSHAYILQ